MRLRYFVSYCSSSAIIYATSALALLPSCPPAIRTVVRVGLFFSSPTTTSTCCHNQDTQSNCYGCLRWPPSHSTRHQHSITKHGHVHTNEHRGMPLLCDIRGADDVGRGSDGELVAGGSSDWHHPGPAFENFASVADTQDRLISASSSSGNGGGGKEERPSTPPLEVLYRDNHIAAVCKPPLIHVHRPEFGSKDPEFVLQKARNQLGRRVYFPHRLDRGTSGCLLLGFTPEASKILHRALADNNTSCKTYVAVVRGSGEAYVGRGWFTVDRPIKDDKNIFREASTRFLFVAGCGDGDSNEPTPRCSLVLAQPSTGRFHQIRRHLNGLSHPVVGDSVHGNSRFNREIVRDHGAPRGRLLLHCLSISLPVLPEPGTDYWYAECDEDREEPGEFSDSFIVPLTSGVDNAATAAAAAAAESEISVQPIISTKGRLRLNEEKRKPTRVQRAGDTESEHEEYSDNSNLLPASAVNGNGVPVVAATRTGTIAESVGKVSTRTDTAVCGNRDDSDTRWKGLRVWCNPPDDMITFLRRVAWWKEDLLVEALAQE